MNSKFYMKRTIYLGDSAHSFHTIAGQGWNLGIGDVKKLIRACNINHLSDIEVGIVFL